MRYKVIGAVYFAATLSGIAIGACAVAASPNVETGAAPALQAVIQHEYPQYKIVAAIDIDLNNCDEPKAPPGLVEGDFNGDNLTDYAVILVNNTNKKVKLQGQLWDAVDVKFVIYLGRQGGGLQKAYMESFDQNPGLQIVGLQLVPAGVVVNESPIMGNKKILLQYQGVDKYHCGKWADVYYWGKKTKRFDAIRVIE